MKSIALIPARLAATRFPNKPLATIAGLEMIEHVRRRVELSQLVSEVWVATCDAEIHDVVKSKGGKVIMTSTRHERCIDRIAEAAESLDADVFVCVQGDEPLVMPHMIDSVIGAMKADRSLRCINLVSKIVSDAEFESPNTVKIIKDLKGNMLYLSREPIPSMKKSGGIIGPRFKQLGIMGFTAEFLATFAALPQSPCEINESVDMLRILEHGYSIRAIVAEGQMIGVDIPSDIARTEQALRHDPIVRQYLQSAELN